MNVIKKNIRGMLLLEVLLVVVILSFSLTLMISALTASARGIAQVRDYSQAIILLEDKLSEIAWTQDDFPQTSGTFDPPFDQFRYRVTVSDFVGPPGLAREPIPKARVEILWGAAAREKKIGADVLTLKGI